MPQRSDKPQVDREARKLLYQRINERFISPKERKARIEAAYSVMGYKSLSRFAYDHGLYPSSIQKAIDSPRPSMISIYKLAISLGVSIAYLTERDYFKKGKRDRE